MSQSTILVQVQPKPHVPKGGAMRHSTAAVRVSQDVASGKLLESAARRKAAAEWVKDSLGVVLPTKSDKLFRFALRDGVTLCKMVNLVAPLAVPQVTFRPHPQHHPRASPTFQGNLALND